METVARTGTDLGERFWHCDRGCREHLSRNGFKKSFYTEPKIVLPRLDLLTRTSEETVY